MTVPVNSAEPRAGRDAGREPGEGGHVAAGGRLVLAGTPLGRISDASSGLRQVLESAEVVAAEDTRRLRRLAADLGVTVAGRVVSYYEAVERARLPALLAAIHAGKTVLLVTDAGMPSVSDPGFRLVAAAAADGLPVTCVPGPSAVTTALAVSGLPSDRFCFEGFLPRRAGERRTALAGLVDEPRTMVFFESVHRIADTLAAMLVAFGGDRRAVLCRELTKTHEDIRRGTLAELAADVESARGELTLVVAGAPEGSAPVDASAAAGEVAELVAGGLSTRDAVARVALRHGLGRRVVYEAAHRGRQPGSGGKTQVGERDGVAPLDTR